jgi:hypothetical protein
LAQTVTPAKAGVQNHLNDWIPAFAGMKPRGFESHSECLK